MKATYLRILTIVCLTAAPSFAEEPKPKAKTPDLEGTWNLVSAERNGKELKLRKGRVFFTGHWVYAEGVPFPDDFDTIYWGCELTPGDKPNIAFMNLEGAQGRHLIPGICTLDGSTLRIVLSKLTSHPGRPVKEAFIDRPKEFATKPGSDHVLIVLKRAAAADDPLALLRKLGGSPSTTLGGTIYLTGDDGKRTTNDDLAIIKKYPLVSSLSMRGCQVTDAGLVHLKDMQQLTYLTLDNMPITNAGLTHLIGHPKLIELSVSGTKVTGEGVKKLTQLTELNVSDSAFTDADLAHLKDLTKLKRLDLSGTKITDAGLAHLKPLTKLDSLFLDKTAITDAGLSHLHCLTKLRYIRLKDTKVTEKGIEALQAAIPAIEDIRR
jgi:uncharacterized protein (TIGR03067 family)